MLRKIYAMCFVCGAFLSLFHQSWGEESAKRGHGKTRSASPVIEAAVTGLGSDKVTSRAMGIDVIPHPEIGNGRQEDRMLSGRPSDRSAEFDIKITPQIVVPDEPGRSSRQNGNGANRRDNDRRRDEVNRPAQRRIDGLSNSGQNSADGNTGFFGPGGATQHSPGSFGQR